jgi:hypothetical protein
MSAGFGCLRNRLVIDRRVVSFLSGEFTHHCHPTEDTQPDDEKQHGKIVIRIGTDSPWAALHFSLSNDTFPGYHDPGVRGYLLFWCF